MAFPVPFQLLIVLIGLLLTCGPSLALDRVACQAATPDPLIGCPSGTLLVGPASSGASFSSVQSAILSIPNDTTPYTILILPGTYTEQLNVTRRGPLTLLGQTDVPTNQSSNSVTIAWAAVAGTGDNAYTSTLTVAPTLNASLTGAGPDGNPVPPGTPFGCTDFRAYNIDFVNDYAPYSDDPSLAISISYANSGFYYCGFYSYQDTVYIGKLGNAYIYSSTIAGQTDFLYGFGTLWVQSSLLSLRGCGGGITAWKGTNTTFENMYGVYIHDSAVLPENATVAEEEVGQCALGRPWNAQDRSLFAHTYLSAEIRASGYIPWEGADRINFNTTMAEFETYGPGFNLTGRLNAGIEFNLTQGPLTEHPILTEEEYVAGGYSSLETVFQDEEGTFGCTSWIDRTPWL